MSKCNCCQSTESRPVFEYEGYRLVACTHCNLTYVANPPGEAELAKLYATTDEIDYHAELRDPASVQSRRMHRVAGTHLKFTRRVAQQGTLLDVGCSTGSFLKLAAGEGFDCAGVEFSESSAKFAREQTGAPIELGSIHETTAPDASLDVLTMFDVIEHVPDPASDLAVAWAKLKPGGWLVLSTPNIDGLFPRASYALARKLNYWPHPEPPYHLYQFSVATLSTMLEQAGFELGPVEHLNIDLAYTFGTPATLSRMPKRLAYAAVFAPIAKIAPWLGQGDWFYIAVRKPLASTPEARAA
jgi:SAM-dependent methyltransferase